jgi:formyltetrahydrofolate synthetase
MNHGSAFLYSNGRFLIHWFVGVNKVIGNLDFAAKAKKDFEIESVEYLNQFSQDKAKDKKYLEEIKKRSKARESQTCLL